MAEALVDPRRRAEGRYELDGVHREGDIVRYPVWMRWLFVIGAVSLLAAIAGLMLTPLVGTSDSAVALFGIAAGGMGLVWFVVWRAPRNRFVRR